MMLGGGYEVSAGVVLWAILALAVVVLIAVGIVLLVTGAIRSPEQRRTGVLESRSPGGTNEKTPVSILEERYARGEIDREEFLQRKADLMQ